MDGGTYARNSFRAMGRSCVWGCGCVGVRGLCVNVCSKGKESKGAFFFRLSPSLSARLCHAVAVLPSGMHTFRAKKLEVGG